MAEDLSPGTPIDVAAIERAYVEGKVSVEEICARFAINKYRLYRLAEAGGWPRRLKRRAPTARTSPVARLALVRRLYRRFERHMEDSDARHEAAGVGEADPVAERDARTMSILARTLEKLIELEDETRRPAAKEGAATVVNEEDVESMRAELARRFSRLAQSGEIGPPAGEPEPE